MLRIIFISILGVIIGFATAVAYGVQESSTLIVVSSAIKSVVGAILMEVCTDVMGFSDKIIWLVLWILISLTLATKHTTYKLHSARNFEQERADLQEGMNNLMRSYQEFIAETLQDDALSTAEKTGRLQAYKSAIIEEQKQYEATLQQINEDEIHYNQEQYGFSEAYDVQDNLASKYCSFSDETEESSSELSSDLDSYTEQNRNSIEME